jgi:inner membrane protein
MENDKNNGNGGKRNIFTVIKDSIIFRIAVIGIIILLMLIPFGMIMSLIGERESRRTSVIREINSNWAFNQSVIGPVIDVPFITYMNTEYTDEAGKKRIRQDEMINYAHFLPEKLEITGKIIPEIRYRGIYKVVVYSSVLSIKGYFLKPDFGKLDIPLKNVKFDNATVSLGISDMRGIYKTIDFKWNGGNITPDPGVKNTDIFSQGINSKVQIKGGQEKYSFEIGLSINGSESINFLPVGKDTGISLVSDWKSPSFTGLYLPKDRTVTESGFKADWRIFDYNREFPQQWINKEWDVEKINKTLFGVELFTPVDEYQKTIRCTKYAILFIFLTFLTFFILIELILKRKIHPIQYLLIGFALCMFYLLLISLSEHIPFDFSYLISTVSVIAVILVYTASIAGKKIITLIMGFLLTCLYGFLYITLQLEDYSLLMGSLGLFVILAVIMIFTRKFDWYSLSLEKKE